jgi:EEF1A lysine methyltransferase 4
MAFSRSPVQNQSSFDSEAYWDHRFAASQSPFDWLTSVDDSINVLEKFLVNGSGKETGHLEQNEQLILHIGCGTSELSFRLRHYVRQPSQVHNVDFSQQAVDGGRDKEKRRFASLGLDSAEAERRAGEIGLDAAWMRWSKADLLSLPSVLSLVNKDGRLYDLVLDKSTSDAISCGDDVQIPPAGHGTEQKPAPRSMHAVEVLALHLAAVTATAGRWIVISYSAQRLWFLEYLKNDSPTAPSIDGVDDLARRSFSPQDGRNLDPTNFWQLKKKQQMIAAQVECADYGDAQIHTVYRPQVYNWLYVLVRTNTPFPGSGIHAPQTPRNVNSEHNGGASHKSQ